MPRVVTYHRSAPASDRSGPGGALHLAPEDTLVGAFQDQGVSGLTPPDARPGLSALLDTVAREGADILLIPAWSHLSRDRRALPALVARLTQAGVRVQVSDAAASASVSHGRTA